MIAKGAGTPIVLSFVPSLVLLFFSLIYNITIILPAIFLLFPLAVLYFFRDPNRPISKGIVSPADGRVLTVNDNTLTIFMGIKDVHVNRTPVEGRVLETEHILGTHRPAYHRRSASNERQIYVFDTEHGKIVVTQVAGIFARRIVPYVQKGDHLEKGQRFGLIRFGSRVELKLPSEAELIVKKGDTVRAGETMVGDWR